MSIQINFERKLALIAAACLLAVSATLVYRIDLHSDILFLDYLFRDLMKHGSGWTDWRLSPAPSYFPDMLVYFVAYWLIPTVPLRILFVTYFQIVVIAILCDRVALSIKADVPVSRRIAIQFLMFLVVVIANHTTTEIGIFFNANNIQVPTLISSLILEWLLARLIFQGPTPKVVLGILIVGAAALASSAVFLLSFALPCIASLIFAMLFANRGSEGQRKNVGIAAVLVLGSLALGSFVSKAITYNEPLAGRVTLTADRAATAANEVVKATLNIVALDNAWSLGGFVILGAVWVISCLMAVRSLVGFVRRPKKNAQPVHADRHVIVHVFVASMVLMSSATSIVGSVASGGFADIYGYRYFMTFVAFAAIYLLVMWPQSTKNGVLIERRCNVVLLGCYLVLAAISLLATYRTPRADLTTVLTRGAVAHAQPDVAACLDDLLKAKVPLQAGVADYWYARGVEYFMSDRLHIEPVTPVLSPFYWISSRGPLLRPEKYGIEKFNFLVTHGDRAAGFDRTSLATVIPASFVAYPCKSVDAEILYYEGDQLDRQVRLNIGNFSFERWNVGEANVIAAWLPSQTGVVANGGGRIAKSTDQPGFLLHGPYSTLVAGRYLVQIDYRSAPLTPNANIGYLEVGRFVDSFAQKRLAFKSIPAGAGALQTTFEVPSGGLDQVETRVFFSGSGELEVDGVKMWRLADITN